MKFFEKLFPVKQKTAAYFARERAVADVANWLRKLPPEAIVQARKQERIIIVEVVS